MKTLRNNFKAIQICLAFFVLLSYSGYCQGLLYVDAPASITITDGATLTLENTKLRNNGTFKDASGIVNFTGDAAPSLSCIEGTGLTNFNTLVINKASNDILLKQNINVANALDLTKGGLDLSSGNIDFGNVGIILNETEANRVYGTGGYLITTLNLTSPTDINPGNFGAVITSAANLGATIVKRSHSPFTAKTGSIERVFEILPANNSALAATLKFKYFNTELSSNDKTNIDIFQSTDQGLSWTSLGAVNVPESNYLQISNVPSFSMFTVNQAASPLKVNLISFKGFETEEGNLLEWLTSEEMNADKFEIQRSENAKIFETIGSTLANGNSKVLQKYQFVDAHANMGINYYRLKAIDLNGSVENSNIIAIHSNKIENVVAYPNPATRFFKINIDPHKVMNVELLNNLGTNQTISVQHTTSTIEVAVLTELASGIYILKIKTNQGVISKKVFIE